MSLRRLAAVATREVARISRAGPPPRVPGPASAAFIQTRAIAQANPHTHGLARVSAVAGSRFTPPTASLAALRAARALRARARHGSSKAGKHKLDAPPPRGGSSASPPVSSVVSSASALPKSAAVTRASAASLHLAVENAYLNWVRNGITATALGMAFVHFRVTTDDAAFSIGGAVLQTMGAAYVFIGAVSYVSSAFFLRRELALTGLGVAWYVANAAWPIAMYATGMLCLLDWHPSWLLALLAANAESLPEHWQDRCVRVAGDKARRRADAERKKRAARNKTPARSWGE